MDERKDREDGPEDGGLQDRTGDKEDRTGDKEERTERYESSDTVFSFEAADTVKPPPPTEVDEPGGKSATFETGADTVVDSHDAATVAGSGAPPTRAPRREAAAAGPDRKTLGPYEILSEIGRGGMGVVYKAFHPKLKRIVALKVLIAGEDASEEAIARFHREAESVAKLGHHPHIVPVYDIGQDGRLHYFAMHFVDGKALDRMIEDDEVGPRKAALIARKTAEGLHHAHGLGVLHRDIKPANILVTTRGDPQITDFGLAKDVEAGSQMTRSGITLGTPQYMPPEQADGRVSEIDARSDVYSLGATLYELLTGQPPFSGATLIEVLRKVMGDDPVAPRKINPRVDVDLETICLECLEKEQDKRYATAGDLAADLGRYLDGAAILARPPSLVSKIRRRVRRHRSLVIALAAAAAVLVLAVAGVYWRYAVLPEQEKREAREQARAAREAREREGAGLLASARADLAAGRVDEAGRAAEDLVERFAPHRERGEDVPIAEGHLVLAEVARRREKLDDARYRLFRAYEAASGTEGEPLLMARIGHMLYSMRETDLAQQTFERVLQSGRAAEATVFEARLGIAKCTAAWMEFDRARAMFAALADRAGAAGPEAEEIEAWQALLALLRGRTPLPFDHRTYVVRDLDRDGRGEILCVRKGTLHVARIEDGQYRELARLPLFSQGQTRHSIRAVEALDADGDGDLEILLGGGYSQARKGGILVVEWAGGRPFVAARAPCHTNFESRAFSLADTDGDGEREIVAVTAEYLRTLFRYRYTEKPARLERLEATQMGSDMFGTVVTDIDGDGRDELWVLAGGWGVYGCNIVKLTRARGEARPGENRFHGYGVEPHPFSSYYRLDRSRRPGESSVVCVASWWSASAAPVRCRLGEAAFRRQYRPVGAYLLDFAGGGLAVKPLVTLPWEAMHARWTVRPFACRLRSPRGDFVWAAVDTKKRRRDDPHDIQVFHRRRGGWSFLAQLSSESWENSQAESWDLDGDGDDELVCRKYVLGLEGGTPRPSPGTAEVRFGGAAELPPPTEASPTLRKAREARRLRVFSEAIRLYREETGRPRSRESLEEAARGLVDCLLDGNRLEEAAREAQALADRYSMLLRPVGLRVFDRLADRGEWMLARPLAERLRRARGMSSRTKARVRKVVDQAEELSRLETVASLADLLGHGKAPLLASSPVAAAQDPGGALRLLFTGDQDGDIVLLPLAYRGGSIRFAAAWKALRHEWHVNWELGLCSGMPGSWGSGKEQRWGTDVVRAKKPAVRLGVESEAFGSTELPSLVLHAHGNQGHRETPVFMAEQGDRMEATLEFASLQSSLRCRIAHPRSGSYTFGMQDLAVKEGDPLFLFLRGEGIVNAVGRVGEFRLEALSLLGRKGDLAPAPFTPETAVDHFFAANGLVLRKRHQEALKAYDRVVDMAGPPEGAGRSFLPVDARFWRALCRARLGQPGEAVRADLEEAARLNPGRFDALVHKACLVPAGEPAFLEPLAGVVKGFYRAPAFSMEPFVLWLLRRRGYPVSSARAVTESLGHRFSIVRTVLRVEAAEEKRTIRSEIEPGDELRAYGGEPVEGGLAFLRAQYRARREGRRVEVEVLREGETLTFTVDPSRAWLVTRGRLRLEKGE